MMGGGGLDMLMGGPSMMGGGGGGSFFSSSSSSSSFGGGGFGTSKSVSSSTRIVNGRPETVTVTRIQDQNVSRVLWNDRRVLIVTTRTLDRVLQLRKTMVMANKG